MNPNVPIFMAIISLKYNLMNGNFFKIRIVAALLISLCFNTQIFAQKARKTETTSVFQTGSITISHAPSAWFSGFAGAEFEASYRYKPRKSIFAAYRQVLYQMAPQFWVDKDFSQYYHSLRSGYQFRAGLGFSKRNNGPEFIRFSMEYGSFHQMYTYRECGDWSQVTSGYCVCNRIDDRKEEFSQIRLTGRAELVLGWIRRKNWGIESSAGLGFYVNKFNHIPFMEASACTGGTYALYSSLDDGEFILLDGIPLHVPLETRHWGAGFMPSLNLRVYYVITKKD
jgi:hypothetical protein